MEKVAKELAFNRPSQQVDEILRGNNKEWFFKAPNQHQPGRAFEWEAGYVKGVRVMHQ